MATTSQPKLKLSREDRARWNLRKNIHIKVVKAQKCVKFLSTCRSQRLIPTCIRLRPQHHFSGSKQFYEGVCLDLLEKIEYEKRVRLSELCRQLQDLDSSLSHCSRPSWANDDCESIQNLSTFLTDKHEKKLTRLRKQQHCNTVVVNQSSRILSPAEYDVLALGLDFIPTPKKDNLMTYATDTIASVERCLKSLDDDQTLKDTLREKLTCLLAKTTNKPVRSNLTYAQHKALHGLARDQSIRVVRADKGNKTVVLDEKDYVYQIEHKLKAAPITYEWLTYDPTGELNKKFDELLKNVKKWSGKGSNCQLAYVRGQPKTHKPDCPMRLIVCMQKALGTRLARQITMMLKPIGERVRSLRNTAQFIAELQRVAIDKNQNCQLISLDIEDLFTSVPPMRAVDLLEKQLQLHHDPNRNKFISDQNILSVVRFLVENVYFSFNNSWYRQLNGLPMGSSLSPLLADLYVHDCLATLLRPFVDEIAYQTRYVDDMFLVVYMNETRVSEMLSHMNAQHSATNLRFTCEIENKRQQLPFLDTCVQRECTYLTCSWYRKPTAADRYLNYASDHTRAILHNIVKNMTNKILETTHPHAPERLNISIKRLTRLLLRSGYPCQFVKRAIKRQLQRFAKNALQRRRESKNEESYRCTVRVQHRQGLTEHISRLLQTARIRPLICHAKNIQAILSRQYKCHSSQQQTSPIENSCYTTVTT